MLAIFIGVALVGITLLVLLGLQDDFRAVKFANWMTADDFFSQVQSLDFIISYVFTWLVLSSIFAISESLLSKRPFVKSVIAFSAVYILATIVYIISGQVTMSQYLEYAFWALIVGLLFRNIFCIPEWMQLAIKSGSYIKAGLVIMGTEVLFSNITEFGFYGVAIVLLVVPATMIFMWYFGTITFILQGFA